jgi:NTE family protein
MREDDAMSAKSALVLGGGGVAGIAWTTGVVAGLAAGGVDVTEADLLVGTSAGSTVAAQLGSGLPVEELFRRQAEPGLQNKELVPPGLSVGELWPILERLFAEIPDPVELRRRIGALALAADTVPESARLEVIEGRLPVHAWPDRALKIVAVDAHTGEPRIFDRASGVALVDAVAASCALPGIWPPVTIGDTRYVDGGVRSIVNADLAEGHDRILVIAPMLDPSLDDQIAKLEQTARVALIAPDADSLAAFGADPLDPETRTPSAQAGRARGLTAAPALFS